MEEGVETGVEEGGRKLDVIEAESSGKSASTSTSCAEGTESVVSVMGEESS